MAQHISATYADRIMAMVHEDMASGTVPRTVRLFTDLHSYVDANDYLTQAGMDAAADDEAAMSMISAVCEVVSARLSQGL
jgi:hypothetical protein